MELNLIVLVFSVLVIKLIDARGINENTTNNQFGISFLILLSYAISFYKNARKFIYICTSLACFFKMLSVSVAIALLGIF